MLDSDDATIEAWLRAKHKQLEAEVHASAPCVDMEENVKDHHHLDEHEHDHDEHDEVRDTLSPLPHGRRHGKEKRRHKSVSCPTTGSMFGDLLDNNDDGPVVRIKAYGRDRVETTTTEETTVVTSSPQTQPGVIETTVADLEAGVIAEGARATTTLRRRRHKTVSCPPHMLFMEAERHVNANYFFG